MSEDLKEYTTDVILKRIRTGIDNYKRCREHAKATEDEYMVAYYTRKIEERERFYKQMETR